MYGYVYLTHCSKTDKYYIGVHKFENKEVIVDNYKYDGSIFDENGNQKFKIDPNYLGSGVHLKRAIRKYGRKYFYILSILDVAYTKEELYDLEVEWIKYYKEKGYNLYNISNGGLGGWQFDRHGKNNPMYGKKHSEETKRKISIIHKNKRPWNYGIKNPYSEETLKKMSKTRKEMTGKLSPQYGKKRSNESKQKMRESKLKLIENGWKPKNNIKGCKRISKDGIKKFIKQEELEKYLNDGWKKGW